MFRWKIKLFGYELIIAFGFKWVIRLIILELVMVVLTINAVIFLLKPSLLLQFGMWLIFWMHFVDVRKRIKFLESEKERIKKLNNLK